MNIATRRSQSTIDGIRSQSPFVPYAVDPKFHPQDPDTNGCFVQRPSYLRRHIYALGCKQFDPVHQKQKCNSQTSLSKFSFLFLSYFTDPRPNVNDLILLRLSNFFSHNDEML